MRAPADGTASRAGGPTAFVLGLYVWAALGTVRSLGRAGVPVVGLGPGPAQRGFSSRYCTEKQCPHPLRQPDELVEFLRREGSRLSEPGILFPTYDDDVVFVSRYRDDLRDYFRFNIPSPDIIDAGTNKRRQYELAEKLGVPYPTTYYPEGMDDVLELRDRVDYPVFIKPYASHLWQARFGALKKGIKVHTREELTRAFEQILPSGLPVMVQEIVPGPNTNNFNVRVYVSTQGQTLAVFTCRKIRQYPPEFGVGTLVESEYRPDVIELGMRYFQGVNYRGFGYIEFKRDDRDGKLKMIELNPRFSAQIIHATDCGINFPLIQYLDLIGEPPPPQMTFKEGTRWLHATRDLRSAWAYFRAGELSPWAWVQSLLPARSFAVFAPDDPTAFFGSNRDRLMRLLPRPANRRTSATM